MLLLLATAVASEVCGITGSWTPADPPAVVPPPSGAAVAYSFPTSAEDYGNYYVTAYYDQGGTTDWNCGNTTYSGHRGSDYGVGSWDGMYEGRDITAAADGYVLYTNDGVDDTCSTGNCEGGGGYGNYVWMQHADGKQTIYAHMRTHTVSVTPGDYVACGHKIGEVGSSGYSTGPHLHFEVRTSGGSQHDPFNGSCSSTGPYWSSQGSYEGLPALVCDEIEPCSTAATLSCGQTVSGRNDDSGSTDTHSFYGCEEWTYSGPELALGFSTDLDETVQLSLTGLSDDLDLYVLSSDACDGSGCVAASSNSDASDESLSFSASAGHTYTVVVDGWEDAVSSFALSAACEGSSGGDGGDGGDGGSGDGGDTSPTVDTAPPTTDSDDPGKDPPPDDDDRWGKVDLDERELVEELGGCGCGTGAAGAWWLLPLLALRRRSTAD